MKTSLLSMVPGERFELSILSEHGPKPCAYANSATQACICSNFNIKTKSPRAVRLKTTYLGPTTCKLAMIRTTRRGRIRTCPARPSPRLRRSVPCRRCWPKGASLSPALWYARPPWPSACLPSAELLTARRHAL